MCPGGRSAAPSDADRFRVWPRTARGGLKLTEGELRGESVTGWSTPAGPRARFWSQYLSSVAVSFLS